MRKKLKLRLWVKILLIVIVDLLLISQLQDATTLQAYRQNVVIIVSLIFANLIISL